MYRQKRESEYEKKIIYIKKRSKRPSSTSLSWCPEQDSNLHASRHAHLKRARLPFRHLAWVKKKSSERESMFKHLQLVLLYERKTRLDAV